MMVPKLRFSEFSGEWENDLFGRIVTNKSSKYNPLTESKDLPCLEMDSISQEDSRILNIYSAKQQASIKNKFSAGDVLFGKLRPYLKKYILAPFDGACSSEIWVLNGLTINNNFLFYYIQTEKFIEVANKSSGSKMPRADWSVISSEMMFFPLKAEQNKIAEFLSSVDEKITLLNKQYNLLCQYKKGMMQKIFNQEVRFRDENGEIFPAWQENILSNFGNAYSGLTGKTAEDFGKGTFYITYKQIFDNRIIQPKDFGLVCISKNEKQNKVEYGDLFFTTSSETPDEVAFCSVFLETKMSDCYLNSFCFGYRLKNIDENHPVFLSFLFRSEYFRAKVKTLAQGSTRYNISKAQFMMLSVNIPVTKEQTKIANFLSALDDKIAIKKVELDRLKTWKQGLLQQMFV
ncbi:TPA: restriction endonuclease subunit S [Klebsiella variicola subsp. variicola]